MKPCYGNLQAEQNYRTYYRVSNMELITEPGKMGNESRCYWLASPRTAITDDCVVWHIIKVDHFLKQEVIITQNLFL